MPSRWLSRFFCPSGSPSSPLRLSVVFGLKAGWHRPWGLQAQPCSSRTCGLLAGPCLPVETEKKGGNRRSWIADPCRATRGCPHSAHSGAGWSHGIPRGGRQPCCALTDCTAARSVQPSIPSGLCRRPWGLVGGTLWPLRKPCAGTGILMGVEGSNVAGWASMCEPELCFTWISSVLKSAAAKRCSSSCSGLRESPLGALSRGPAQRRACSCWPGGLLLWHHLHCNKCWGCTSKAGSGEAGGVRGSGILPCISPCV